MSKDWKYILYISLAVGAFVLLKLLSPRQLDWTVTFAPDDKNPFGGYAMHRLIQRSFPAKRLHHSFKTWYELKDSLTAGTNLMVVAQSFSPGKEDTETILSHVQKGGVAFISAEHFYGIFADTLGLQTYDTSFKFGNVLGGADTTDLHFAALAFDTTARYRFRQAMVQNYISNFDSVRTTVVAENAYQVPVTIRMQWGAGLLLLNSTPRMFTNICLLRENNADFLAGHFSYLTDGGLTWTEYYQRGRREITTPLRFILMNEPLRWAYYITLITLVVFMIFEMKRRQRIIPVIPPVKNTTLEFVSTIGNLYYENGDHKNMAEKKIAFFVDQVKSLDPVVLAKKLDRPLEETDALTKLIATIKGKPYIGADMLMELNTRLEKINRNQ